MSAISRADGQTVYLGRSCDQHIHVPNRSSHSRKVSGDLAILLARELVKVQDLNVV